jgi:hypothetical protein
VVAVADADVDGRRAPGVVVVLVVEGRGAALGRAVVDAVDVVVIVLVDDGDALGQEVTARRVGEIEGGGIEERIGQVRRCPSEVGPPER